MNYKQYAESIIGFFVIAAVGMIILYGIKSNPIGYNKETYAIFAKFKNISGIRVGSEVQISGIAIGKVATIELDQSDDYKVALQMNINNTVNIPRHSAAIITSNSPLSENKYIKIEPISDSSENDFIQRGESLYRTQSSNNVTEMIINRFLSK